MSNQIAVEVAASPLWDNNHKLLGYFPAIFGPSKSPNTRTYWIPAVAKSIMRDPKLYPSPAKAMEAWEKATPRRLEEKDYPMPLTLLNEINERGLLRE